MAELLTGLKRRGFESHSRHKCRGLEEKNQLS